MKTSSAILLSHPVLTGLPVLGTVSAGCAATVQLHDDRRLSCCISQDTDRQLKTMNSTQGR